MLVPFLGARDIKANKTDQSRLHVVVRGTQTITKMSEKNIYYVKYGYVFG